MAKQIALTNGQFALVDNADYEWLNQWRWYATKEGRQWYAKRHAYKERSILRMHRIILGLHRGDKMCADHIDGDGLNNQRDNLRKCTRRENMCNQKTQKGKKSSKYKGVHWDKDRNLFRAQIKVFGKKIHIGHFINEGDAAHAYDRAAMKHFREFACVNFKHPSEGASSDNLREEVLCRISQTLRKNGKPVDFR